MDGESESPQSSARYTQKKISLTCDLRSRLKWKATCDGLACKRNCNAAKTPHSAEKRCFKEISHSCVKNSKRIANVLWLFLVCRYSDCIRFVVPEPVWDGSSFSSVLATLTCDSLIFIASNRHAAKESLLLLLSMRQSFRKQWISVSSIPLP